MAELLPESSPNRDLSKQKRTVHFVYSFGPNVSCPDAIGREVGARLRERYKVKEYSWAGFTRIKPEPGDILLGHACPIPFTTFRRSCRDAAWSRVILFSPYCHGDDFQPAFNDRILPHCNLYLAITGNYWFSRIGQSGFSHWLPKMRHIDLAVKRSDFPPVKLRFNPPGERKFVYIGRDAWYKNVGYLSELAIAVSPTEVAWIGDGAPFPGLKRLGRMDFSKSPGRNAIADYDFLLTVGKADGNPTTVLEAMSWGLIPVCSRESGYEGYESIINVPLDDAARASEIMSRLQQLPEARLKEMQEANWQLLESHFNWDRIARQVVNAIEDNSDPAIEKASRARRLEILRAEVASPYWSDYLNPGKMKRRLRKYLLPNTRGASPGSVGQ